MMKRREFITLLGGAATAWPLMARAQQPSQLRRLGVLIGSKWEPDGQARATALVLLTQISPPVARAAVLFDPKTALYAGLMLREIEQAARSLAVAVRAAPCSDYAEVAALMAGLAREERGGLVVLPGVFADIHRPDIIILAARYRLAGVYPTREFVASGGMMSYGIDNIDVARRAADYVDRILRGANPADLPVQRPTKFELMINLRTAKALGIDVPPTLLARADEVIE